MATFSGDPDHKFSDKTTYKQDFSYQDTENITKRNHQEDSLRRKEFQKKMRTGSIQLS